MKNIKPKIKGYYISKKTIAFFMIPIFSIPLLLLAHLFAPLNVFNANAEIAISSSNGTNNSNNNNNFLTYKNAQYRFEIGYNSNWQKIDFSPGIEENGLSIVVNFLSPAEGAFDTFREYLIVEAGHLPSQQSSVHLSLGKYIHDQVNDYKKSLQGFQLIESSNNTGNIGKDYSSSSKIVYTYDDQLAGKIKVMNLYFTNKDNIYLLSFKSDATKYSQYLPTVQKMVNSFHIT